MTVTTYYGSLDYLKYEFDDETGELTITKVESLGSSAILAMSQGRLNTSTSSTINLQSQIKHITIGAEITSIGASSYTNTFAYCRNLKTVSIGPDVTNICSEAFSGCEQLTGIYIPDSVTTLSERVFYDCAKIDLINIGAGLTSIGQGCFDGCIAIRFKISTNNLSYSVTDYSLYNKSGTTLIRYASGLPDAVFSVPEGVVSLDADAFHSCPHLTTLNLPSTNTTALYPSSFRTINATNKTTPIAAINVDSNNQNYTSVSGAMYNKNVSTLIFYPFEKKDVVYNVPDTVTTLSSGSIYYNQYIETINFSDALTTITGAISYCENLKTCNMNAALTTINSSAGNFSNCPSLTTITIDPLNTSFVVEDNVLFTTGKTRLIKYPAQKKDMSYEIPLETTSIDQCAFQQNNHLRSITLNSNVTAIRTYAFLDCQSLFEVINLSSLTVTKGSTAQGYIGYYAKSVVTSAASAILTTDTNGFTYAAVGGVNYLVAYSGSATDLTLPDLFNGATYQIYKYAFLDNSTIVTLSTTAKVTTIGIYSFKNCSKLESITLGSAVTITKTDLDEIFSGCNSLSTISVENNNQNFSSEDGVLFDKSKSTLLYFPNAKYSTEYTLPATVTDLNYHAFTNCTALYKVTIPTTYTPLTSHSSQAYAFWNCKSLIILDSGENSEIFEAGRHMFLDCTNLSEIRIPINIDVSNENTRGHFVGCTNISKVIFSPGTGETAGVGADYYLKTTPWSQSTAPSLKVIFEAGITSTGRFVLSGCRNLTSVSLNSDLETIDEYSFLNCTSLKVLTIPEDITAIGYSAFKNCSGLEELTAPLQINMLGNTVPSSIWDGCTSISRVTITKCTTSAYIYTDSGDHSHEKLPWYISKDNFTTLVFAEGCTNVPNYTFKGCDHLESVTFASTHTTIGQNAFEGCTALVGINLGTSVTTVGANAFKDCTGARNLTLPANIDTVTGTPFAGCNGIRNVSLTTGAGTNYTASNYQNTPWYQSKATFSSLSIGSDVTSIGAYTFRECTGITYVHTEYATAIGAHAFEGCAGIRTLVMNHIVSIGESAFQGCVLIGQTLSLPNSLTTVGANAFKGCTFITATIIPSSITSAGASIFENCTSLSSVSFDIKIVNTGGTTATFKGCTSLKNVIITNAQNIVSARIASEMFRGCTSLQVLSLSSQYTNIAANAFNGCTALRKIENAYSVNTIGANAFEGCTALEELPRGSNTAGTIGAEAFKGCTSLTTIETHPTASVTIGANAFEGCTGLTNITFNAAFSSIGDNAFEGCTGVEQVMFRKALGSGTIGDLSFSLGTAEDEVQASAFSLGDWASSSLNSSAVKGDHTTFNFYPLAITGLDGLTYTFGSNGVLEVTNETGSPVGMTAVSNCILTDSNHNTVSIKNLVKTLVLDSDIPSISSSAFYTSDASPHPVLESVTYSDPSFTIGANAFNNCTELTEVIASASNATVSIGESSFKGCTSLTSFEQAGHVSALGMYAFKNCRQLTAFSTTSVTEIPDGTFDGCLMLSDISLNNSITEIGTYAFYGCISLPQIDLPESLQTIKIYAFSGCTSLQTITIPVNVTTIGAGVFKNCTSLSTISVDPDNLYFMSEDGILFSKTQNALLRYPPAKPNANYTVPSPVYFIREAAFEGNTSITNITLQENLRTIEDEAFRGCTSLTEMIFPSNLTSIGWCAFAGCYSLVKITFTRSAQMHPDDLAFVLGTTEHEAECLVESPNNWAQNNMSAHPNQWTTLTFRASYYEAIDGLRYSFDGSILQVSGSGPSTSLTQGRVALTSGNSLDVTGMTAANFEEGITSIAFQAMMHCQQLTTVTLPQSMTTVSAEAFRGCTSLKTALLPRAVSEIPIGLFYDCPSLEEVIIPQNVSSISRNAYTRCYSVKNLVFYGNEPTISASEEKALAMGTQSHEAYVTVQSFNNWAESANLEQYSNAYTHFTYETLILVGADGLTYKVENNTLYVEGNGAMTSLANRVLTTQGGTITLPVAKSAVIGAGVTSISTDALKGFGLELMTFRSAPTDGGNIVEGDYSDAVWNGAVQPRTYVYGEGRWLSLDSVPFVLVFSPGGGQFTSAVVPSISISVTSTKEDNGRIDTTQHTASFKELTPYQTVDGVETYLWYYISETIIEAELQVQNLPTVSNNGITPPTGFASIRAWEAISPYHLFGFSNNESPSYDGQDCWEMTIERPTTDSMKHIVAYPFWVPDRGDRLRALITAPGLGSLDFENIQAVDITYHSNLTVIPIVCYGHKGTFCMDLGVTKTVSISYLRVSPENPINDGYDSRLWDNATWIKRLREFTDRWQLRTNGCTFYLKRPNNPRLANGFDDNDPMADFIGEIDGENCYITSTPIKYAEGMPYAIKSTLSLKMGTLYPKQVPTNMTQVILKWGGPNDPWIQDMTYYLQYPKNMLAIVPPMPGKWSLYTNGNEMSYASGMYVIKEDGSEADLLSGNYFDPTAPTGQSSLIIYSKITPIGANNKKAVSAHGGGTFTIQPYPNVATIRITIWMVGAGGGGGGGYADYRQVSLEDEYKCAGGAGGASGRFATASFDLISNETYLLDYEVGEGGEGGRSGYKSDNPTDGWDGGFTRITLRRGSDNRIVANPSPVPGGRGGPKATNYNKPGEWGGTTPTDMIDSYRGGNGGGPKSTYGAYANDGDDGECYGKGTAYDVNTYGFGGKNVADDGYQLDYRIGGGGGGGGSISISGFPYNLPSNARFGGQGTSISNQSNRDGMYGGGGGGGSALWTPSVIHDKDDLTPQNGGKGGDGVLFIIVNNGTIS